MGRDNPEHYLLLTSVTADKAQDLRAFFGEGQLLAICLNGQRVRGDKLELRPGPNELLMVYSSGADQYSRRHYGAFFRLVDPATGQRATTVHYRPQDITFLAPAAGTKTKPTPPRSGD